MPIKPIIAPHGNSGCENGHIDPLSEMSSDEKLAHKTWQAMCDVKYSSNTHDHIKPILEAFKQIREEEWRCFGKMMDISDTIEFGAED